MCVAHTCVPMVCSAFGVNFQIGLSEMMGNLSVSLSEEANEGYVQARSEWRQVETRAAHPSLAVH